MPTLASRFAALASTAVIVSVALLGCASTPAAPAGPDPTTAAPAPVPDAGCPSAVPGEYGPAVALQSADLLGISDLPADVCAYSDEARDMIWIFAEPFDPTFTDRITSWLTAAGWTAEDVGPWGEGDLVNISYTPPAGNDFTSAYAHVFDAYPDSVSLNLGIDQEFLTHFGVEPGDKLAIFAAWN
ncbi:MAG: hypothetical protein ABIR17_00935 [Pseudolysinimonas sp.]|uniref:hypothetical protein n=1 Tax=Pseudolysinimonas sp. TaxID=2680009 RepID=UPI003265EC33